jgi:hypothetical protein
LVYGGSMMLTEVFRAAVEESGVSAEIVQISATLVTAVLLVVSLPCVAAGVGMLSFRPWARILGIVIAVLNLLNLPFGTAVAIYSFWVLLKPETEALFKAPPPA